MLVEKTKLELDNIKSIITDNIESVLQRGEKLDTLELKTEELNLAATTFMKAVSYVYCLLCLLQNFLETFLNISI